MKPKFVLLFVFVLLLAACAPVQSQSAPSSVVQTSLETKTVGANIWVGIIILAIGIGGAFGAYKLETRHKGKLALTSIVLATIVLVVVGSFVTIDQGQVGVLVRFGKAIEIRNPGLNTIIPYVDQVVLFSTRDWTYATMSDPVNQGNEDYKDWPVDLISADGVQSSVKYTIQGRLDPTMALVVYQRYGTLENAITQAVKSPSRVIVRQRLQDFIAPELYQQVDSVDEAVISELKPIMRDAGLTLVLFGFRKPTLGINGDYEAQLNAALVAEQAAKVAQQNIAVKEAEAKQAVAVAEGNKQVAIKEAEARAAATLAEQKAVADAALYTAKQQAEQTKVSADATAYKTKTEATAQADANKQLASSVTAQLIEYLRWSRWDGKLPQWVSDLGNLFVTAPAPVP